MRFLLLIEVKFTPYGEIVPKIQLAIESAPKLIESNEGNNTVKQIKEE